MIFSKICLLFAFLAPVAVSTITWYQDPYGAASSLSDNSDFNNAPKSTINHLSAIGDSEYTALTHPQFPNHRVRIKKSNFCDPTVKLVFVYCHLYLAITLIISLLSAFIQATLMLMQVLSICFSISLRVAGIRRKVYNSSSTIRVQSWLMSSLIGRWCYDVDKRRFDQYRYYLTFFLTQTNFFVGPGCSSSMGLLMELGELMSTTPPIWLLTFSTYRTLQHRYEGFLLQWHGLESLFMVHRSKCLFLGSTVMTSCYSTLSN